MSDVLTPTAESLAPMSTEDMAKEFMSIITEAFESDRGTLVRSAERDGNVLTIEDQNDGVFAITITRV